MNDKEFEDMYCKLPNNLKYIIDQTLKRMEKTTIGRAPSRAINIKKTINYYRKKNKLTNNVLYDKCMSIDPAFNEDTFKQSLKRGVVDISNNQNIQTVIKVLNIPNVNGIPYIDNDDMLTKKHKNYQFTKEYYSYIAKYQTGSALQSFMNISEKNQKAIIYLTKALYYNERNPELFENKYDYEDIPEKHHTKHVKKDKLP